VNGGGAAFISNRQLILWDNAFKEELPKWTLNFTKWRICIHVKHYCNKLYTNFVFIKLPGVSKSEKLSLSLILATDVRVRFQSRQVKQLSRPPHGRVSKLCVDYPRPRFSTNKTKISSLIYEPNLKKSKLRNWYLLRSLRQWEDLSRATGRTGRYFDVPKVSPAPFNRRLAHRNKQTPGNNRRNSNVMWQN
jgi:hypothetical protein